MAFANAAGEEILAAGDGLRICGHRLSATRPDDAAELRRVLAGACAPPGRIAEDVGGFLRISRPSGRAALVLMVASALLTYLFLRWKNWL